jgi:muramoyltetrapeptide carboxypeptidase LdcA involved in peptidoglycan recycling
MNDALCDPGVRAGFSTSGGKGAYRIADGLDFDAASCDPKPLVGFSEITILRLALAPVSCIRIARSSRRLKRRVLRERRGDSLRQAGMESGPIIIRQDPSAVIVEGTATGILMGGSLTEFLRSGCLEGVKGVAVGQCIRSTKPKPGRWSIIIACLTGPSFTRRDSRIGPQTANDPLRPILI